MATMFSKDVLPEYSVSPVVARINLCQNYYFLMPCIFMFSDFFK